MYLSVVYLCLLVSLHAHIFLRSLPYILCFASWVSYGGYAFYVELLHEKKISSFLVMNGQHPDLLEKLDPVTQLYVSVDAPNKVGHPAVSFLIFLSFSPSLLLAR